MKTTILLAVLMFAGNVFAQDAAQETPEQVRAEARRAGFRTCVLVRDCLHELTEQLSPEGTPFDQMTPHSHFLTAEDALNNGDFPTVISHFRAIDRNSRYGQVHHDEMEQFIVRFRNAANEHNEQVAQAQSRGPVPASDERGGNYRQVRTYMQTRLADPRSYQPISCTAPEPDREGYHNTCTFRARNQFGALSIRTWDFLWIHGRVVYGGEGIPLGETIEAAIAGGNDWGD